MANKLVERIRRPAITDSILKLLDIQESAEFGALNGLLEDPAIAREKKRPLNYCSESLQADLDLLSSVDTITSFELAKTLEPGAQAALARLRAVFATGELTRDEFVKGVCDAARRRFPARIGAGCDEYIQAIEWSASRYLKPLTGSRKMILHAELVRRWFFEAHVDHANPPYPSALIEHLLMETRAKFWLDFGGTYEFWRHAGAFRAYSGFVIYGLPRGTISLEQVMRAIQSFSSAQDAYEMQHPSLPDGPAESDLLSFELTHHLPPLAATSPLQRSTARAIRARGVIDQSDVEALIQLRSARQILNFWRGHFDDAALRRGYSGMIATQITMKPSAPAQDHKPHP